MNRRRAVVSLSLSCAVGLTVACSKPEPEKGGGAIERYADAAPELSAPYEKSEPGGASGATLAPGRAEYEKAKDAVWSSDHRKAAEFLAEAARLDPEVCEYWYQLGAAESNLAIDVVNDSQSEAVRLFENSVDHKTEALRLMKLGKCPIWTDEERAQARMDAEMALKDAEEVLRDKTTLVQVLQMYAEQRSGR